MRKLYIGNLPYRFQRSELVDFLSHYGEVDTLHLVKDKSRRRLKGFGFVTFVDDQVAEETLNLDGQLFGGRNIKISVAKDQNDLVADDSDDLMEDGACNRKRSCCVLMGLGLVVLTVVISAATSYVVTDYVMTHNAASIFEYFHTT